MKPKMKCGNIFLLTVDSYKVNYKLMEEMGINGLNKETIADTTIVK